MVRQNETPTPSPAYETLAALLSPTEREVLEALGEIIALDLLRQEYQRGTALNTFETDFVNPVRGRAC